MAKPHDLHQELADLGAHVMSYNAWLTSVLQLAFYPVSGEIKSVPALPPLLIESLARDLDSFKTEQRSSLAQRHKALQAEADALCATPPERSRFKKFSANFGMFLRDLQSISQNRILEIWGLDVLTGLRNKKAMLLDMVQELERVARHGQAFSLALAQIDNYQELLKALGQEGTDEIVKSISGFVSTSLRSFDGAYYIGEGEFVLSLKHASALGGQKALERLRNKLEKTDLSYEIRGQTHEVTMSCCVAEPLPEDNIEQVIENLRGDLNAREREDGAVLVYYEVSPLQRLVESQKAK